MASLPPTVTPGPTALLIGQDSADLAAGTYAFRFPGMDAPGKPFPSVLVTVGAGWNSFNGFALQRYVDTRRQLGLSFWNVVDVHVDPCRWQDANIHPGPTAADLATVLAHQPHRSVTTPRPVVIDGYHGLALEWSVPDDIDVSTCDRDPGDAPSFFEYESWTGDGTGGTARHHQGPGQLDRLWILDIEGRRLVIDAASMPSATAQDQAELQAMVDSIRFEP